MLQAAIQFPDLSPEIFLSGFRLRLRAALVRDGLYRGHPDRLAHGRRGCGGLRCGRAIKAPPMTRADRGPADLGGARGDPWRAAGLRAVLPAGLLPGRTRGDPDDLAGRHVVSRRASGRGAGRGGFFLAAQWDQLEHRRSAGAGHAAGAAAGRIANFINAELWGRPTDLPWGVVFPGARRRTARASRGSARVTPRSFTRRRWRGWSWAGADLAGLAARLAEAARAGDRVFLRATGWRGSSSSSFRQPDAQFISPGNPLGPRLHVGGYGLTMGQIAVAADDRGGLLIAALRARRPPTA
jgi:hypothetical protein